MGKCLIMRRDLRHLPWPMQTRRGRCRCRSEHHHASRLVGSRRIWTELRGEPGVQRLPGVPRAPAVVCRVPQAQSRHPNGAQTSTNPRMGCWRHLHDLDSISSHRLCVLASWQRFLVETSLSCAAMLTPSKVLISGCSSGSEDRLARGCPIPIFKWRPLALSRVYMYIGRA